MGMTLLLSGHQWREGSIQSSQLLKIGLAFLLVSLSLVCHRIQIPSEQSLLSAQCRARAPGHTLSKGTHVMFHPLQQFYMPEFCTLVRRWAASAGLVVGVGRALGSPSPASGSGRAYSHGPCKGGIFSIPSPSSSHNSQTFLKSVRS